MGPRIRDNRFSDTAGSDAVVSGGAKPLHAGLGGIAGPCRAGLRLLILLFTLGEIAVRFTVLRVRRGSHLQLQDRAQWLHVSCAMILRRLGIATAARGRRPAQGLICSNHLSYLDILVYAAVLPCVFVSKREVARWPAIGWYARVGGTIFVDRKSRADTGEVTRQIAAVLQQGVPVLLFPEGTSTDGSIVQRFHPSLLEPAVQLDAEMTAAAIGYRADDAHERDMCWYGDAPFTPHLVRTMTRRGITAEVEFYPSPAAHRDRKAAAIELREQVQALRMLMRRETAQQNA